MHTYTRGISIVGSCIYNIHTHTHTYTYVYTSTKPRQCARYRNESKVRLKYVAEGCEQQKKNVFGTNCLWLWHHFRAHGPAWKWVAGLRWRKDVGWGGVGVCLRLTQRFLYVLTHCNILQHTATHCNTLHRTATRCNVLKHTATHCNTPGMSAYDTTCPCLWHDLFMFVTWLQSSRACLTATREVCLRSNFTNSKVPMWSCRRKSTSSRRCVSAHGGDETSNICISRLDSFSVHSFEWRGLLFTPVKNWLKFWGLPWNRVWKWIPWYFLKFWQS